MTAFSWPTLPGIYRQSLDGKLWERLVDGGLTTLVMPNVTIAGLTGDGGDGFHALLSTGENSYQLMHYVFDPNTPTNPDTELTVFSLKDNSTIRQTIGEFQRRNPNVRVNFRVALDENASATTEDIIRSLNTEILSGNGPDILLLDGLPVDSYIEKGVLTDITALIDRMVAENGLMSNLMGAYARDGKIYGAPARFTLPVMMGKPDEVASVTSLEALLKLTEAGEKDDPPFLRAPQTLWDEDGTGMLMEFYDVSASSFLSQDGVDETALADYFRTVLALDESVKRYTPESNDAALTMVAFVSSNGGYEIVDIGASELQAGLARFHCTTLSGIYGLENICSNLSRMNYGLDSLFGRGQYTPVGAVGILSTSSQQELATSFVEMMLSPTVQDSYLSDGFPVNGSSLEKLVPGDTDIGGWKRGQRHGLPRPVRHAGHPHPHRPGGEGGGAGPDSRPAQRLPHTRGCRCGCGGKGIPLSGGITQKRPSGKCRTAAFYVLFRYPGCRNRPQASPGWRNRHR